MAPNEQRHMNDAEHAPHERRNFWILVIYQVVLRAGWIFKTESVVMPHAADALDPSGLARGWLPLLNRFGQSVPPVLAARQVKNLPKKQRAFMTTTAAKMSWGAGSSTASAMCRACVA